MQHIPSWDLGLAAVRLSDRVVDLCITPAPHLDAGRSDQPQCHRCAIKPPLDLGVAITCQQRVCIQRLSPHERSDTRAGFISEEIVHRVPCGAYACTTRTDTIGDQRETGSAFADHTHSRPDRRTGKRSGLGDADPSV